jgi:RimJ/RimL family protein N-acetyltransferase
MMIRFDRAQMDGWFTAWLDQLAAADRSYWPLIIEVDSSAIGFVMLSRASEQVAELQWYVAPVSWGRGHATDATRAVLAFVFGELGVHRLFATVDPANEASVRVLERTGFRREGHMIDYVLTHNGWRDRFMYALLADESVTSSA